MWRALVRAFCTTVPMLRLRQKQLVARAVAALQVNDNTLAVAPTGSGKTFMFSSIIREMNVDKTLVIAHRDELTAQNRRTFAMINPDVQTSVYNASKKSFDGKVTFGMIQTMSAKIHLDKMAKFDLLVVDEAHHVYANTYQYLISRLKELNPQIKVLGMTATPNRGDRNPISSVFTNVCDQISLYEMIQAGHLVKPTCFICSSGQENQLRLLDPNADEAVGNVLNNRATNDSVLRNWQHHASDRQTVIFCSTLNHARDVYDTFVSAGIKTVLVHGNLPDKTRQQILADYAVQKHQVVVNVAVLGEGWDDPLTSCVVLLRMTSHKGTMMQMIGRGMRVSNRPDVAKNDCIVLDFGLSLEFHKLSIEQVTNLFPTRQCPSCKGTFATDTAECPLCGHVPRIEDPKPTVSLPRPMPELAREVQIMQQVEAVFSDSEFSWHPFAPDNYMASSFEAFAGVFFHNGRWYTIGGALESEKKFSIKLVAQGGKVVCVAAASDFMNMHMTPETTARSKAWHKHEASEQQKKYLPAGFAGSKYEASVLLALTFNRVEIESVISEASNIPYSITKVVPLLQIRPLTKSGQKARKPVAKDQELID